MRVGIVAGMGRPAMVAVEAPTGITAEQTVSESNAGDVRSGRGRAAIASDLTTPSALVTTNRGHRAPAGMIARATNPEAAVERGAARA